MITITLKNADKIQQAFREYPEKSAKEFNAAIRQSLIRIQTLATMKAPRDQGHLYSEWDLQMGFMRGSLAPKMPYAPFIEFGTAPHWAPIAALIPWAKRHGISPYAVQQSIAKKGTKAQPFFVPAVEESLDDITKYFQVALAKIPPLDKNI